MARDSDNANIPSSESHTVAIGVRRCRPRRRSCTSSGARLPRGAHRVLAPKPASPGGTSMTDHASVVPFRAVDSLCASRDCVIDVGGSRRVRTWTWPILPDTSDDLEVYDSFTVRRRRGASGTSATCPRMIDQREWFPPRPRTLSHETIPRDLRLDSVERRVERAIPKPRSRITRSIWFSDTDGSMNVAMAYTISFSRLAYNGTRLAIDAACSRIRSSWVSSLMKARAAVLISRCRSSRRTFIVPILSTTALCV